VLTYLRVRDLAIVGEAVLEFGPGLTAITGETGAGKSLLVGALDLLLGGRATGKLVRRGAERAEIEAQFDGVTESGSLAALAERGIEVVDGVVIVRRVIGTKGSRRAFINGRLATASDLREVVGPLVDLCGQHQHARLLSPERQLDALDRFAGLDMRRGQYKTVWQAWRDLADELQRVAADTEERRQRRDFLQFCATELAEAGVEAGETERLENEARRLHSAHELLATAGEATRALTDEHGIRDALSPIARQLADGARLDGNLAALSARTDEVIAQIDELAADLERYMDAIDLDDERRAEVDERLAEPHRLARKYGGNETALLQRQSAIEDELHGQVADDERLERLQVEVPRLLEEVTNAAAQLTERRIAAGKGLARGAGDVLSALGMPGAALDVAVAPLNAPGPNGGDRVVFQLSSNRGEIAQPLRDVASGGELSRVFLAIERACAPPDSRATMVFDEVDAGIGGETATVLGRFLAEMAAHEQVICITHLPQVAAFADRQMHVEKREESGRTVSHVRRLHPDERVTEIARMLGGTEDPTALAHARTLLKGA